MEAMFRKMLATMLGVLALGAVTASAAEAIEGVHFKVAGAKLGEGQSKELTSEAGKVELGYGLGHSKCSTQIAPGAKISGSPAGNPGTGELELEFTNCTGSGKCALTGSVKTKPLTLTLGGVEGTKFGEGHGELAALLKVKSGTEVLRWKSKECGEAVTQFAGELAVTIDSGDKVGEEKPEAKTVELTMPYLYNKFVLVEGGVALTRPYERLSGIEGELYLAGSVKLDLASGENWGVFQKQ